MKTAVLSVLAVVLIAAGVTFWGMGTFNVLVQKDEEVNAAWAQVQNAYQRRLDLIPNLVEAVKAAAKFEKETLAEVARARAAATGITIDAKTVQDPDKLRAFEAAQSSLGGALARLLVSMEKYPDLKATEQFQSLQGEMRDTEDRIEVERHNFNAIASSYNAYLRKMPANIIAAKGDFKARAYFKAEEAAAKAPKVQF